MAQGVKDRADIGVEHPRIDIVGLFGERRAPFLETGIVEHGIEAPELRHRPLDRAGHVRFLRDVGGDEQSIGTQSLDVFDESFT